ncbi:MAG: DUF4340 domain-containing protein [Chloroflexi bacterium]|nr:MAG: DUF4340 domain-containing protein [Chloroflexota bacterium]
MRLNLSTLILLVVGIAIIAAALILTVGDEASEDDLLPGRIATPETPNPLAGPLFPSLNQASVIRVEMRDNHNDTLLIMQREEGAWQISEAVENPGTAPDPLLIANTIGDLVGLIAVDGFITEDLTDFGLDEPAFMLSMMTADETQFTLRIGRQNPSGNRYYALRNDDDTTIYMIPRNDITNLTALIDAPPYLPPPENST